MKCSDCKYLSDDGCTKIPSQIEDQICLLRHIAFSINLLLQDDGDDDTDGDWWKDIT